MPDRDTDLIEKLIGGRLQDIAAELSRLNEILEGFRASTQREMEAIQKHQGNLESARRSLTSNQLYMSGRWHRRDGNVYDTIAPQPAIPIGEPETKPRELQGPLTRKQAETIEDVIENAVRDANHPPRDLRPSTKR